MRGRIICITPVKHLEGVYERLEQYENFFYEPNITKDELSKRLSSWEDIEYLFTNPNKQNFVLDEEVLGNSNIKVINTCSTGLNHIDMDYCERNNESFDYVLEEKDPFYGRESCDTWQEAVERAEEYIRFFEEEVV